MTTATCINRNHRRSETLALRYPDPTPIETVAGKLRGIDTVWEQPEKDRRYADMS